MRRNKILALLCAFVCMFSFTACGGNDKGDEQGEVQCTHIAGEGWVTDGTDHWHVCTQCGEKTDLNAHSGGTATCTAKAVCDTCGEGYGALADHNFSVPNSDDDNHWYECVVCQTKDTQSEQVHDLVWDRDSDNHWKKCTGEDCDYTTTPEAHQVEMLFNEQYHWTSCKCEDADSIPDSDKTAHGWSEDWTTDGTNHWHVCTESDCKAIKDSVGHTFFVTHDTTDHWEQCSVCEEVKGAKAGHEWSQKKDASKHWQECACGEKKEESAHSSTTWLQDTTTGEHYKECACGQQFDRSAHSGNWVNTDASEHWKVCASCGEQFARAAHATAAGWTVSSDGTEEVYGCECGYGTDKKIKIKLPSQDLVNVDASGAYKAVDVAFDIGTYASVESVKLGDTTLNATKGENKLTFAAGEFSNTMLGDNTLTVVVKTDDGVEHTVTAPVCIVTKLIATKADLQSIKAMVETLEGKGYYKLTANINYADNFFSGSVDYGIGSATMPFNGTVDGNGFAIDNLRFIATGRSGGFIHNLGKDGVLKNIAFTKLILGAANALVYDAPVDTGSSGNTIRHAGTLENVYVQYKALGGNSSNGYVNDSLWTSTTTFFHTGAGISPCVVTMKNVVVDFSKSDAAFFTDSSRSDMGNLCLFGSASAASSLTNVAVIGAPYNYKTIVENNGSRTDGVSHGIYVKYYDNTDPATNGVNVPDSGWDETYWTMTTGSFPAWGTTN